PFIGCRSCGANSVTESKAHTKRMEFIKLQTGILNTRIKKLNHRNMKKVILLLSFSFLFTAFCLSQNVGVGTTTPNEKLNIDSGNVRIGKAVWQSNVNSRFLKFGDADYITLGEEEADDKLTLRAKELIIRPSPSYTSVPVTIKGTDYYSHFFFGTNEDTYLRGGKNGSNVNINDIAGGRVGIGMSNPTRAMLEQNGSVGNTAAIFGGEGAGISLQRNWPAIGFNHWYDGSNHKSIGQGYSAQMAVSQTNGSLYFTSWPFAAIPNASLTGGTTKFFISRFGKIGIGADAPTSDIEITQRIMTFGDEFIDAGITYNGTANYGSNTTKSSWNTHVGQGRTGSFADLTDYSFWNSENGGNWYNVASINTFGEYYQASDRELKKDISYLSNSCLSKIMLLKPATYHFKRSGNDGPLSFGFIAQEVETIFPEMILNGKTNKLLSYSSFIPILTKGMQEQQQQIEDLKKEIQTLKNLILKN
ncbi:MAG: tail fiber domain-containing protein, partial [Ferruginibacter sp.]